MKVVGFAGFAGVGKTTLIEGVLPLLRAQGLGVSVVKHADDEFDVDLPGKDSWRLRKAGAFETVVASSQRLVKVREFGRTENINVHQLIWELEICDWVLVEGFKHADIGKLEIRREALGHTPLYEDDPFVRAVVTDDPAAMPVETLRDKLSINDPAAVAAFLLANPQLFEYRSPFEPDDHDGRSLDEVVRDSIAQQSGGA
jgi:molybdopterin-guanine dinucleotide biosynthesis protein B